MFRRCRFHTTNSNKYISGHQKICAVRAMGWGLDLNGVKYNTVLVCMGLQLRLFNKRPGFVIIAALMCFVFLHLCHVFGPSISSSCLCLERGGREMGRLNIGVQHAGDSKQHWGKCRNNLWTLYTEAQIQIMLQKITSFCFYSFFRGTDPLQFYMTVL